MSSAEYFSVKGFQSYGNYKISITKYCLGRKIKQETHGSQFTHLSKTVTAYL